MDCGQFCLPCCVGICCREWSWLGVRLMLRSEGLVLGCTGGCLLYFRVRREGWYRQFVVLWSVFCVGGIFACIGFRNNSYVYFYDMFLIVAVCLLLSRTRIYFVGYALPRRIVDYWILCTLSSSCVLCLWIFKTNVSKMGAAVQQGTSSFPGAPKIWVLTKSIDDFLIMRR